VKIRSVEVETDLGRRVVQLSPPLDLDPTNEMPAPFRSLTEVIWAVLRDYALQTPSPTTPKAEA
jgi:hypothetical protein